MKAVKQTLLMLLGFVLLAGGALIGVALVRERPQDLPWTRLDLTRPVGAFTGRKIAGLTSRFAECRAMLRDAGINYTIQPPAPAQGQCGYADGVRFAPGGSREIAFRPANPVTSCPVAAALAVWEWRVVQPAARRRFGKSVVAIEHLGSYSCRRIYGRSAGDWSEHATADAIDVAAFLLSDGTRIAVLQDWSKGGEKAGFLHEVRTGGCRLFSTVLSPDYNAAHRDHLHLDEAARGEFGWRTCR